LLDGCARAVLGLLAHKLRPGIQPGTPHPLGLDGPGSAGGDSGARLSQQPRNPLKQGYPGQLLQHLRRSLFIRVALSAARTTTASMESLGKYGRNLPALAPAPAGRQSGSGLQPSQIVPEARVRTPPPASLPAAGWTPRQSEPPPPAHRHPVSALNCRTSRHGRPLTALDRRPSGFFQGEHAMARSWRAITARPDRFP